MMIGQIGWAKTNLTELSNIWQLCFLGHNTTVSYKSVSYKSVSYKSVSYKSVSYKLVSYKSVSYKSVSYKIKNV